MQLLRLLVPDCFCFPDTLSQQKSPLLFVEGFFKLPKSRNRLTPSQPILEWVLCCPAAARPV